MIITIDGTVGTGKSTVAKTLANRIRFIFFDTGAMYRTLTYAILKEKIHYQDDRDLKKFLDDFHFDVKMNLGEKQYLYKEEDVTLKIRNEEVTDLVSEISAKKVVREKLVEIQRNFSNGVNAVFEGRDMGTVVFPNAELKIFLSARPEVRALRRYNEMVEKFPEESKDLTLEKVQLDITERDKSDEERLISPLKKADDAYLIDTSELTIDEVIDQILEHLEKIGS